MDILFTTLAKQGAPMTIRALSKQANVPYATTHRALKRMHVTKKTVGKATTIELANHPSLPAYLAVASETEKELFLEKQPLLKKLTNELDQPTLLFGSYAKGTQTKQSDIDLIIIGKPQSFTKYETLFKTTINPLFVTKEEFVAMLKSPEETVAKQAMKHHIILRDPLTFWEAAYGRV